jgi:hypothetical protein
MKNFASKGLVAAAVASACAYILPVNFANAATLTGPSPGDNHSRQGLAAAASNAVVTISPLSYVAGTTMIAGDRVRFTLSAGTAAGSNNANPADTVCESTVTGQGDFTLEFSSFSGSTVTYQVKNISGTTNGTTCALLSLGVLSNSISSATTVSVSSGKAPFGGQVFNEDTAASVVVLSTANQYSFSLQTAFNGEVNYTSTTNSGLNFSGDDDSATGNKDNLSVKLQSANLLSSVGTPGSVRFTLTAAKDFKFLDNNGDGSCTAADLTVSGARGVFVAAATGSAATYSINEACTVVTVESTGSMPINGGEYTLTVSMGRNLAAASVTTGIKIEPQDFANTSLVVSRNSTGTTATTATYDPGEWTQNGATYIIPYMPYNSSATARIDPTLYVTNRGISAATVTASARNENGVACNDMALGTANATSTFNAGPALATALNACYGAGTAQRLYITINIATARSNTEVYSGFNVIGSGRGTVVNNSNGNNNAGKTE